MVSPTAGAIEAKGEVGFGLFFHGPAPPTR
jgi:hypothetical protein